MFFESSWTRKSIGDVDVLYHDHLYHLFHLVLPNHDFIAHAISDNGVNWRRVDNALFIGDPGGWDDLMLWTMHVTADPHRASRWRMFYTGLSRRDQGRVQRIGMAVSDDLFTWRKTEVHWNDTRGPADPDPVQQARASLPTGISDRVKAPRDPGSCFPLESSPPHYESSSDNVRNWVSFRDPYYFRDGDRGWLLAAARVNEGPILRRGCVGLMEEVSPNHFQRRSPLHAPMQYDDIEVPNLFRIDSDCYLVGSLREDAKVRYWTAENIGGPWKNHADNVLLPRGNYAARVCQDDDGFLLWNFYNTAIDDRSDNNIMPPPKRLARDQDGRLRVSTFEGLTQRTLGKLNTTCLQPLKASRELAFCRSDDLTLTVVSEAGFQGFVFDQQVDCFQLLCRIQTSGVGKCGILSRIDPESHDGYYLSLDLLKGVAQYRSWKTRSDRSGEDMLQFDQLQDGYWRAGGSSRIDVQWLAFGSYHELSVNGKVVLSLVDATFGGGLLGFYVETAELRIDDLVVHRLQSPTQSDDHLVTGPG